MSFGLLKKSIPEKVQRRENKRPQQKVADVLTETFLTRRQREWHAEMKAMHQRLDQRQKESQQRRLQESPLRRVHPLHERDEEELDYYSRGNHASVQRRSRLRRDQEARSLRHVREEQTISKPKAFSKSYTANPVAKGKAVDSNSKSECRTRTTGRVHIPSPHVESGERVKSKAEAVHYRTREVRCFKCQGLGHFANECTNKKTMVLFEHGEFETKQEVENASASEEEELVKILVKDDISVSSFKTEKAVAKEQENKENDQDQLMLETKNEEAMKQSLGSIDESADALTERYSLMSTPDSYTLRYKVVEKVDFVFGNSAFSKPENKVKSLLAEVLKPRRDKQMLHFRPSKTEPVLDFEEESLFQEENGVSETFSFDHFLFLKDHKLQDLRKNHIHSPKIGMGAAVQRRDHIVDKVKDGRKVMEPTILEDYGVPATPQERSLSLSLESACRDDTDLRTNLFQEEGYDMIMGSIKDDQDETLLKQLEQPQDHELNNFKDAFKGSIQMIFVNEDNEKTIGSFYDEIIKLPERTHVHCSEQKKLEINWFNSLTTWIIFSTHHRIMSKWNPFNQSSNEGDIEFTSQMIFNLLDLDQHTFKGGFLTNQKELSYEPNFTGILIHSRITENWILIKIGSDVEGMNFTNGMICFRFNLAYRSKNEFHSPTQELSRHETTWEMLMDLLALQQAQDRNESPLDHKDTLIFPRWVNMVLNLKSSRPDWIVSFQTYVWHPGGISTKSSKPSKPNSWS